MRWSLNWIKPSKNYLRKMSNSKKEAVLLEYSAVHLTYEQCKFTMVCSF
jgi:hypothetical protein